MLATGLHSPLDLPSGPIREAEVTEALPSVPTSWVRRYVEDYGTPNTSAHTLFHYGAALCAMATTCPANYSGWYAGIVRPNIFVVCTGRSGRDFKSASVKAAIRILHDVSPGLIGEMPSSDAGLLMGLKRNPTQCLPFEEFGKFLALANKAAYFEPVKTLLTDLFDAGPAQRVGKKEADAIRVDNPRLSCLAGCSIPFLEDYTTADDWHGGFLGRWCILLGKAERIDPDPIRDDSLFGALAAGLSARATIQHAGCQDGRTEEAGEMWDAWFHDLNRMDLPPLVSGIQARAPTIARKVALILGWDYGPAPDGEDWRMTADILAPALKFTNLYLRSIIELSKVLADSPDARLRAKILSNMEVGQPVSLGYIIHKVKLKRRTVLEALETLVEEGMIDKGVSGGLNVDFESALRVGTDRGTLCFVRTTH